MISQCKPLTYFTISIQITVIEILPSTFLFPSPNPSYDFPLFNSLLCVLLVKYLFVLFLVSYKNRLLVPHQVKAAKKHLFF